MATNKRVFTLRLSDEVFDKIGVLATREHRSMTNYIEYVLLKHIKARSKKKTTADAAVFVVMRRAQQCRPHAVCRRATVTRASR